MASRLRKLIGRARDAMAPGMRKAPGAFGVVIKSLGSPCLLVGRTGVRSAQRRFADYSAR